MAVVKILSISDEETLKKFSVEQIKEKFGDVDFILSAGDLGNEYLDFVFTALNKDLIYVHGNHTYQRNHDISFCKCIDGRIIDYKGVRILGFDGSMAYNYSEHQYTEFEMAKLFWKNIPFLLLKRPDIVLSHSPPAGIHDAEDLPHRGFKIYLDVIKFCRPKIWIHGHIHLRNHYDIQETLVGNTKVINTFGHKVFTVEI